MMVLDATKKAEQRALLEAELDAVGIRLNKDPPYVPAYFEPRHPPSRRELTEQKYLPES